MSSRLEFSTAGDTQPASPPAKPTMPGKDNRQAVRLRRNKVTNDSG